MSNKIRPFIEEDDLPVNPFLHMIEISVRKREMKGVGDYVLLEDTRYCKVFVSSAIRKHTNTLSPSACAMYVWLQQEISPAKDYLWINKRRYMDERGIKDPKSVNKVLAELDNKRFIDEIKGMKDVYFINAAFFFNGSRPNKYPKNVIINE